MWFFKRGVILVEGYINLRAGMKERFYRGRERGGQSLLSTGVVSGLIRVACPHGCGVLLALLCDAFSVFFCCCFHVVVCFCSTEGDKDKKKRKNAKETYEDEIPKKKKKKGQVQ